MGATLWWRPATESVGRRTGRQRRPPRRRAHRAPQRRNPRLRHQHQREGIAMKINQNFGKKKKHEDLD